MGAPLTRNDFGDRTGGPPEGIEVLKQAVTDTLVACLGALRGAAWSPNC